MFWMSAFLDLAPDEFDRDVAFWQGVTGYGLSATRGARQEFATLVPPDGDDFLRVQRLGAGASRIHLDLHVEDPQAEADRAASLGATVTTRHELGYVVMASPGGFTFCFVRHRSSIPPRPATWPGGHRSLVDQVCLDLPQRRHETELTFWRDLTGWELESVSREFHRLRRPDGMPLHLLLQRLDDADGRVGAHLDIATTDRAAETRRHEELGARVLRLHDWWTVLTTPAGSAYCITDRAPGTRVPG